jgi:hypothetical protein
MKLISAVFDNPVTEEWNWITDTFVSDDGTEQRIQLSDPPRRTLIVNYQFTDEEETRKMSRNMLAGQFGFLIPAYHLATKIAPAAIGDSVINLSPDRTELRDGCEAVIFDRITGAWRRVTVATVNPASVTLTAPLAAITGNRAMICPLWAMIAPDNATLTRGRVNAISSVGFTLTSLTYVDPFLNPTNTTVLTTFAGLPVLPFNNVGQDFSEYVNTGATNMDFGGAIEIRSRWLHSKQGFGKTFLVQRIFDNAKWLWWRSFADYCKGSCNPFYMPTYRPDFSIVGVAAGASITLKDVDYFNDFFPFATYKQFAIFTDAGVHYTSATAANLVGGNTVVTIDPPLPGGAGYANNQVASLLLQCRIADDKVSCEHMALETNITINMRTVDG